MRLGGKLDRTGKTMLDQKSKLRDNKKNTGNSRKNKTKFVGRKKTTRVKTAKGRKLSSTRWLMRQLNDSYVSEARINGYRSRSAFKLIQLNDKFNFLNVLIYN